jgi:hypothetical protein
LVASALSVIGVGDIPAVAAVPPDVGRKVETRGIPVSVGVIPGCRLGGDDPDAKARAQSFIVQFHAALAIAVADVEFPGGYSGWAAELEVESEGLPPSSNTRRVRIVKPSPTLDLELMRRMLRPNMPALPNFRAKCTFTVRITPWRATEPR